MKYYIFALLFVHLTNEVLSTNSHNPVYYTKKKIVYKYNPDKNYIKLSVDRNLNFSKKLHDLIINKNNTKNFIYSPQNAYNQLSLLAYCVYSGDTSQLLLKALDLPLSGKEKGLAYGNFEISTQYKKYDNITLKTANAIIATKHFELWSEYKMLANEIFHAEVISTKDSDMELYDKVNEWIEKITNDELLVEILDEDDIDSGDKGLVLINVVYFDGNWTYPFNSETIELNFYDFSNNTKDIKMMYLNDVSLQRGLLFNDTTKFVVLPYKNENYSMVIAWPNQFETIDKWYEIGNQLSHYGYNKIVEEAKFELMALAIPSFTIENTINFQSILENVNVIRNFDNPTLRANIGDVKFTPSLMKILQKSYISVNQNNIDSPSDKILDDSNSNADAWIVDRPFFFAIVSPEGLLFEGHIIDPNYIEVN